MTNFTRQHLLALDPVHLPSDLSIPANLPNLIHTDSRNLESGQWFLPIKGDTFDGHKFIASCLEKGAAGFFYESTFAPSLSSQQKSFGIEVNDTLAFFQKLALSWRLLLPTAIIGITGSAGKTTAKEICGHLLSELGKTLITRGSYNNEIGVPLTLAALTPLHRYAVIEMGARHEGDIEFLCQHANPDICVLLNIGSAHVGEFGGPQILRRTKQEMFTKTRHDAIAICPADDRDSYQVATKHHDKVISFGTTAGDVQVEDCGVHDGVMTLKVKSPTENFTEAIGGFHKSYPINFAAALAICHGLGIRAGATRGAFAAFKGLEGRFNVLRKKDYIIVDDCYNANPESMKVGLQSIREGFHDRKYVLVLGDMLELGASSQEQHYKLGIFCKKFINPEFLVGVGKESKALMDGAKEAGLPAESASHYENVDALLPELKNILKRGDLVYVKASHGIKLNLAVEEALRSL